MAADPYTTLGVARDATAEQIRSAYRKLAKQHHPDLNPGNKVAEERFKAVSSANDLLSDVDKRARYDRGEIDAAGDPKAERPGYRTYADGAAGGRYAGSDVGSGGAGDMGDIFADLFARQGRDFTDRPTRGRDRSYTLTVDFVDSVAGTQQTLTLPDGRTLDVKIPPGVETGQVLRLRGQGSEGFANGPAGDALIEIHVAPHPVFRREGNDILLELPVTLREAVLGGKVTVPTTTGSVAMTVPKRSNTGTLLRLRGRGVPARGGTKAGDQLVTLKVMLDDADPALETFLASWQPTEEFDPRRRLMDPA